MASSYPGSLDALSNPAGTDLLSTGHAAQHGNVNDAVEAVQSTLGVNPQGGAATVAARITAVETQVHNPQTGTSYTLVASDAGKLVTLTNGDAITLTVPAATFSAGQRVDIAQRGAGAVTVVGSSVTVNAPPGGSLVLQGQYAYCSLVFISASVADLVGATVAA